MDLRLRYWIRNANSVCVDRGPLTYSLKIGEKYVRHGGTDAWPAHEVYPTTAWNYGLVIDAAKPLAKQFEVQTKDWPQDNQPFAAEAAPIEIKAQARKIPNWQPDKLGLIGEVQPSPREIRGAGRNRHADSHGRRPSAHLGVPLDRHRPEPPTSGNCLGEVRLISRLSIR